MPCSAAASACSSLPTSAAAAAGTTACITVKPGGMPAHTMHRQARLQPWQPPLVRLCRLQQRSLQLHLQLWPQWSDGPPPVQAGRDICLLHSGTCLQGLAALPQRPPPAGRRAHLEIPSRGGRPLGSLQGRHQ
jgi:hypothetical protein